MQKYCLEIRYPDATNIRISDDLPDLFNRLFRASNKPGFRAGQIISTGTGKILSAAQLKQNEWGISFSICMSHEFERFMSRS